jgi:predicted RNA-binding Zn ribbon-like protein
MVPEKNGQAGTTWKGGFLFVGNSLALDFLNTRPVMNGKLVELLPDFNALLRWFQAAGLFSSRDASDFRRKWGGTDAGEAAVRSLREWREHLRSSLVGWESGRGLPKAALAELNRLMAKYPVRTRLVSSGGDLVTEVWFQPQTPESFVAPIAHNAAMLFAKADRSRVRMCGNCVLHFLDTSKKGTRRWCSMELCGNRLKVAAYARRQRKAKLREPPR